MLKKKKVQVVIISHLELSANTLEYQLAKILSNENTIVFLS
jgi:hypothetical protein